MPSHPKTYTAYAFTKAGGQLERITVDWKDPEAGSIVIKVLACGVCAGDEMVKSGHVPLPRVPGHEIIGDVVAVHPSEGIWRVGQRVGAAWHGGHCNSCTRCRSGDFVTCQNQKINGIKSDGGYAEYATIRSESVISVPEDIDPAEAAPLVCAGVTTFNSLRHADAVAPEVVAVHGIGGLGHLGIQFARKMGFHTVALSSSASKQELAQKLGAHEYIDLSKEDAGEALQRLGGAKVIMCTAPNAEAIEGVIPALAVGGTILLLAVPQKVSFPGPPLIMKRLRVQGWPSGTPADCEACIRFAQVHDVKCMVERFPLDRAQEAYDHRSNARFRAVIVP